MRTRTYNLIALLLAPLLAIGCASTGGGVYTTGLFALKTPRSTIEDALGSPVSESPSARLVSVRSNLESETREVQAKTVATYVYEGRVYDNLTNQDLGMMVGVSFGLRAFEAYGIARRRAEEARQRTHRYEVWYALDATYLTHSSSIISDDAKSGDNHRLQLTGDARE